MNTRKLGRLFCQVYNEEHGTNLSPKEIFLDVIIPLVFTPDGRYLMNLTNSKFFNYAKLLDKGKVTENDFQQVIEDFCAEVESNKGGLMDSMKIYGGCAVPYDTQNNKKYVPTNETTMFCYNENIYYDVDERYCSWIGANFVLNCNGFNVIVNNIDFVRVLWESLQAYRVFLNENEDVKPRQIQMWNEIYLCQKYGTNPNGIYDIRNNFLKNGALTCDFGFSNILFIIAKHFRSIKYVEVQNIGQTNITAGAIMLDIPVIRRQSEVFRHVYESIGEDFNTFDYNSIFGGNLLFKAIECGSVHKDLVDPIFEYWDRKENKFSRKFKKEYIELIMNTEAKKMVKDLVEVISTENKSLKKNLNKNILDAIKTARSKGAFILSLKNLKMELKSNNEVFDNVVEYIVSDDCTNEDFNIFSAYLNYNIEQ